MNTSRANIGAHVVICIPCWNNAAYTIPMVESVLRNSEGYRLSFVFVDNGSNDDTPAFLRSVPHVAQIITNPNNLGVNPAWNQMFAVAQTLQPDLVCLANNDILVGPRWLDAVFRELAEPRKRYFLPNGSFADPTRLDADVHAQLPELAGKCVTGRAGWCMFFPPEAIHLFYPIPEEMILWYGDDWIHTKLAEHGYQCDVIMDSCCFHHTSKTIEAYPGMVERVAKDREVFRRLTGLDV